MTMEIETEAVLPPDLAQPLEMLAGCFQVLTQIQEGTGCLNGSMPGALRTLSQGLRDRSLTQERARYTFTSCAGYLQQAVGSMLWKDFQKGPGTSPHQWSFNPDEKMLEHLDKMAQVLEQIADLVCTKPSSLPAAEHLQQARSAFLQMRKDPTLLTFHRGISQLSMTFIELSLAV